MHVSVQLSYRRIRRYLVLPPKEAEKHVTSSHVRFTTIFKVEDFLKIGKAEIDITNFCVFIGNNNSGKTKLMEISDGSTSLN